MVGHTRSSSSSIPRGRFVVKFAAVFVACFALVSGLALPVSSPATPRVDITRTALVGADAQLDRLQAVSAETAWRAQQLARGAARQSGGHPAGTLAWPGWAARVRVANGAQMIGFVADPGATGALMVRSRNARGWSDWVEAHINPGEAPDAPEGGGSVGIGPIWVGRGTTEVEVMMTEGALSSLRLDAIRIDRPAAPPGISQAGAVAQWPDIIARSSWGAGPWRSDNADCGPAPKVAKARYAIIHHTVTTNAYSAAEAYDLILGIYNFHTNSNGWCDIAYNFLVDRFGRIFEGRSGGADRGVIGGHTLGFNTGSIGVALLGQHQPGASPPVAGVTNEAAHGIRRLLVYKFAHHGIDSRLHIGVRSLCEPASSCKYQNGEWLTLPTIIGHRDVGVTSCPGDHAENLIPWLIHHVADGVIRSGPWHPQGGWTPDQNGPAVLTLDGLGGMHPAGSAATVPGGGYWSYLVARGIAGTASRGYVVDGWGGLHAYGSAPYVPAGGYWTGWDIVRGITLAENGTSGYVLSGWGSIHPFGGAPHLQGTGYWHGWDIARGISLDVDGGGGLLGGGRGGYVLDGWGGLHPFGEAPVVRDGPYWHGWDIARAVATNPNGPGGWVLDGWGGVHAFGGAPHLASSHYTPNWDSARGLVMLPDGRGGYLIDVNGGVWPVGNAPYVSMSLTWTGFDISRGIVAG